LAKASLAITIEEPNLLLVTLQRLSILTRLIGALQDWCGQLMVRLSVLYHTLLLLLVHINILKHRCVYI
jgi:hypothetical protein